MRYRVLITDPGLRFRGGDIGTELPNDFTEKYAHKLDLGSVAAGFDRVFYFRDDEVEAMPASDDAKPQDEILVIRARVAAGCSWDGKSGGHGNAGPSQEAEVRRILRECGNRLVVANVGFVDTLCLRCGRRVIVQQDNPTPVLCPPCGGGSICAAYGAEPPRPRP